MVRGRFGKTGCILLGAIILVLVLSGRQALGDPLDNWYLRTSLPQGNNLKNITYANGVYVAVGDYGTVVTSTDRIDWKAQTLVTPGGSVDPKLYAVTYGNGLWVAVGSYIWTSPDGSGWTYRGNPCAGPFYAVTYGNGRFVAAGGTGGLFVYQADERAGVPFTGAAVVATSEDGITWTDRSSTSGLDTPPPKATLLSNWFPGEPTKAIIFAGGKFVQLSWHQPPYYSADGLTFTPCSVPGDTAGIPGYNHATGMAYGNGTYLTVGNGMDEGYGGNIMRSTDGMTWTKTSGPYFSELAERDPNDFALATNLAFGNGVFLGLVYVTDDKGNYSYYTYTSADGVNWTSHPLSNAWGNAIAASPDSFTLAGEAGAIYATTDSGVTWKSTSSATIGATATTYGKGMFAIVGSGGSIYTSPDGKSWTSRSGAALATKSFKSVVYGDRFVASGTDSSSGAPSIVTSADGVTWTAQAEPSSSPTGALAYGNGTYIGIGGSTIYGSRDGVAWTRRAADPGGAALNGAAFGNGKFVVVGDSTIMTSSDAVTWTPQSSGAGYRLVGVAAANGLFVAAGDNGAIRVSPDGKAWSEYASGVSGALDAIVFGAGRFVAIGGKGYVSDSSDGKTWTAHSLGPYGNTNAPWAIAYGNEQTYSDGKVYGSFLAVSANTILESDPVPMPPPPAPASPTADPAPAASGGGGGGGCFIATAAYGGDFAWQVRTFRDFRDTYLLASRAGRAAIRLYYTVSPPIAAFIAHRPALRAATRLLLTPAAWMLRCPVQSAAASVLCLFLVVVVRRRREG